MHIGEPIICGSGPVSHLHWSADGAILVAFGGDAFQAWNVKTRRQIGKPVPYPGKHKPTEKGQELIADMSPDGDRLMVAAGTSDLEKIAQLWDLTTGSKIGPPLLHEDRVVCVRFHPNGKQVLTLDNSGKACQWITDTGLPHGPWMESPFDNTKMIPLFRRHGMPHRGYKVHANYVQDGRRVVTSTSQGALHLWDAATSTRVSELKKDPRIAQVGWHDVLRGGERMLVNEGGDHYSIWKVDDGLALQSRHQGTYLDTRTREMALLVSRHSRGTAFVDSKAGVALLPHLPAGYFVEFAVTDVDGKVVATFESSVRRVRIRRMPRPLDGDPERIAAWVELGTGLYLDAKGEARPLDAIRLKETRDRLARLGGPPQL
jgi:hypothetical protein